MKKVLFILIVFCAFCLLVGEAGNKDKVPATLVLNDGSATYNCTLTGVMYAGNFVYTVAVEPQGTGLFFFHPGYQSFAIKVFEDDYWWGYSQEGLLTGKCSTAYNANSVGAMFQVTICVGPVSSSREANPNRK